MLILGIETSCDDTAVALVRDGRKVLSNIRESQPDHNAWGGVVPEIAARLHAENIKPVLEKAIYKAGVTWNDIEAIAVTQGPGLQTSLLSGTTAASFLSLLYDKPLIPVHHILGHILSVNLERTNSEVQYPALVLTVSGGHTQIQYVSGPTSPELLGTTLDDACGEAFDKLAKMLQLGYPGGPTVSEYAKTGDISKFDLPYIYLEKESLDFSFSGLKAACRRIIEKEYPELLHDPVEVTPAIEAFRRDLCASFELRISKIFVKKIGRALDRYPDVKQVHFVGGVSANKRLRSDFEILLQLKNIELLVPKKIEYCTDNAAMIASAGYFLVQNEGAIGKKQFIEASPRLPLSHKG